jgi:hypothetical protein
MGIATDFPVTTYIQGPTAILERYTVSFPIETHITFLIVRVCITLTFGGSLSGFEDGSPSNLVDTQKLDNYIGPLVCHVFLDLLQRC